MSLYTLLLLAVALAMDAFAVSICGGLALSSDQRHSAGVRFGLWFGVFQALMPILGFFAAFYFLPYIQSLDHWIAFGLLCYLGVNMIRESRDQSCPTIVFYDNKRMLLMAVATSIDALAVGISLAVLGENIWQAALVIGVVTCVISYVGCVCGTYLGVWGKSKAELAGGLVLICLGCKILAEHMGYFG